MLSQVESEYLEKANGYKLHGRRVVLGLGINIENRKGSYRKGIDKDGNKWRTKMLVPYGEIRGTKGTDGEPVDVFIGDSKKSRRVFVIHILRQDNGKYDEDKVMIGFDTPEAAYQMFSKHYDNPEKFFDSMDEMTIDEFKKKIFSGEYHGKMLKSENIEGTDD